MDKVVYKSPLKEWRRPVLRRLPIAAASQGTLKAGYNEGEGGGKGNSNANLS
jgi:hypothetical protein